MAHCYQKPVQMTLDAGQPARFRWRGAHYIIAEVLTTWHLRDRWWMQSASAASDRVYYRVRCVDEQIFDIYHDVTTDDWVLDRAHD